jgi:hypothetical protein
MKILVFSLLFATLSVSCVTSGEKSFIAKASYEIDRLKFEYASLCDQDRKENRNSFACSSEAQSILLSNTIVVYRDESGLYSFHDMTYDEKLKLKLIINDYHNMICQLKGECGRDGFPK